MANGVAGKGSRNHLPVGYYTTTSNRQESRDRDTRDLVGYSGLDGYNEERQDTVSTVLIGSYKTSSPSTIRDRKVARTNNASSPGSQLKIYSDAYSQSHQSRVKVIPQASTAAPLMHLRDRSNQSSTGNTPLSNVDPKKALYLKMRGSGISTVITSSSK